MKKKKRRLLIQAFKTSGVDRIVGSFLIFYLLAALVIWLIDPNITDYFDSLWYSFAAMSTIGFGDVTATVLITRIITVLLWIYAAIVIAILTAVLTGYFMDAAKLKANESVQEFLCQLEHLPELSKEELEELSERVRNFNQK